MFKSWKRNALKAEISELLIKGTTIDIFAAKLAEITNAGLDENEYAYAKRFGRSLKSPDDVIAFHKAMQAAKAMYAYYLTLSVAQGYWQAAGVKTAKEAIALCPYMQLEDAKDLVKQALPHLTERDDILEFACRLRYPEALMVLAIGLGYVPINSFDEAVTKHRLELAEEEERRRRNESGF